MTRCRQTLHFWWTLARRWSRKENSRVRVDGWVVFLEKGYDAYHSEKGFGERRNKTCHCVWDDCCYFWFHKAAWLNFKTSNVFCWERLISLLREYFFFLMRVLSCRYLQVWYPSLYLIFDSLVFPGSKVLLGILILPERIIWTPGSLSISLSHSLASLPHTLLFHSLRIIFQE